MFRTGGMVAISVGALLTAGSMNLAVLNEGPSGPGHLVLRAAAGTTTSSRPAHHTARLAVAEETTSSTTARRVHKLERTSTGATTTSTSDASTTTSTSPHHPTTTTTQPPVTTTTQPPPKHDQNFFTYTVRDAGQVHVQWINKGHTISATALPNAGWTLPHDTKHGPDVTLRFSSSSQLVVWHAWVENHHIHCWTKVYNTSHSIPHVPGALAF